MIKARKDRRVALYLVFVGIALLLTGLGQATRDPAGASAAAGAPPPESALAVSVAQARPARIEQSLTYSGDVKAQAQVSVLPQLSGRIEELRVDVGSSVQAGQVIAVLDHDALGAQVKQAAAGLDVAKARLAQAEAGGRDEAVLQAAANLDIARQKLASMMKGPSGQVVAQMEVALRAAEVRLQELKNGPTAEQRRAAEKSIAAAKAKPGAAGAPPTAEQLIEQYVRANLSAQQAREAQSIAKNPYTATDIAQAADAVIAAEQQLRLARSPVTAQDLDAARAAVTQAEAALDMANIQLGNAYVTAPISGVVTERLAGVGSLASPQTPLLNIASGDVEVQVAVDEESSGQMAVGQAVSLAVTAFPNETFPGQVTSVAPAVNAQARTVAVKIRPTSANPLKPGMFAQATIVVAAHEGALVLPSAAVTQHDGQTVVFLVHDGRAVQKPVRLGLRGDSSVEVLDGLASGDTVVVSDVADLADGQLVAGRKP
jgi:HlyD family secretion protein